MKKLSKSALTLIVVLSLLFAMAITVFATYYTTGGEFKNRLGSGKYGVTMEVTTDTAKGSLSISDYFGLILEESGAEIQYTVYYGEDSYYKDEVKSDGAHCSFTYNIEPGQGPIHTLVCDFYYYSQLVYSFALAVD